jgi:hypothetical protein
MFNEPTIMEAIASVSKARQEYEHIGGFAPTVVAEAMEAVLETPTTPVEPTADTSALTPTVKSRDASLPQSAEAAKAPASVAEAGAA